jgi:hemoglobin
VSDDAETYYEAFGGHETFAKLIDAFYSGVSNDPELRALYPEDELAPANDRLRMFLEQYWGGPTTYHEQRGHPRLRMRHAPFRIDEAQRDRWLRHMRDALNSVELPPDLDRAIWDYFVMAAHSMVNTFDDEPGVSPGERTSLPHAD